MLRGRLGFFKRDFIDLLGGYDEEITGYGHEDHDLLYRSYGLGFTMMWFGGTYYAAVPDHKKHGMENFTNKDWRYTEKRNKLICYFNLFYNRFQANKYREWGKAIVVKNFEETIEV
jgi:predicted glycosyltransferase involved in capsule biosynthesis